MRTPDCAVYTTVYPQVIKFLPAWSESIRAQRDQDFDLWVGVDQIPVEQVSRYLDNGPAAHWVVGKEGESGASIRLRAMEQMVQEYSSVVFVDSDDVLHPTRVESARTALAQHDVVACALDIIDESGRKLGVTFGPETEWQADESLFRDNVFGLSNTAYRTTVLGECLPFPPDCVLIDWFLATRAWTLGACLWFDPVPRMGYRQYGTNTARVLPPFRSAEVALAATRVLHHLHTLRPCLGRATPEHRAAFEARSAEVEGFVRAISEDPEKLEAYAEALNQLPVRYVWWWLVANPELQHIWKT